jgi:hypothetical protein
MTASFVSGLLAQADSMTDTSTGKHHRVAAYCLFGAV